MNSALFAFPSDLADEGPGAVLDAAADRAGVDGLVLAAAYHAARDLYPHNPRGRVRALEPGVVHFRPEPARWAGRRLQPAASSLVGPGDPLAEAVTAAEQRGLAVHGWTVFLHADRLGALHPDVAPRNAFGDPYPTDLCPTHPEVRAYAVTLAAEVASRGVASVVAESLHFHPWEHGEHHERAFVPLSERARLLLGLCFCPSCLVAARAREVDGEAVRGLARAELEQALEGTGDLAVPADSVREEAGPLAAYLEARTETVSTLVAEVAGAVAAEGAALTMLDLSGALLGYATGEPAGPAAPSVAWRFGLDLRALAAAGAGVDALAYARDPERVHGDLAAYRALLGPEADLGVVLRPMSPDCGGPENLRAKVGAARAAGVARLGLYHYGLMPLPNLDWIAAALGAE